MTRKVRITPSDENPFPIMSKDEPVRAEFLSYMRNILASFKFFDKKNPKKKVSPFGFLEYDRMVLIFAEELFKELWFSTAVFRINEGPINLLWDAKSIFKYIYFLIFS